MNSKSWIGRLTNEADMVQYNIHSTELKGFSKCLEIIDICLSAWHKFFTIEIKRDIEALHRNGDKLQSCEKYINRIKKYGKFIVRKNKHSHNFAPRKTLKNTLKFECNQDPSECCINNEKLIFLFFNKLHE